MQTVLKLIQSGYQYNQEISRGSVTCLDHLDAVLQETLNTFDKQPSFPIIAGESN